MSVSGPCVVNAESNCVQSSSYGQTAGYGGSESCRIDHPRADPYAEFGVTAANSSGSFRVARGAKSARNPLSSRSEQV